MSEQVAIVKYQIATYSGTVEVPCDENDDADYVIARARAELRRKVGSLPYGYHEFWVVRRGAA